MGQGSPAAEGPGYGLCTLLRRAPPAGCDGNVRREVAGGKPRDPDSSKGMEVFASDLAGDESLLVGRIGDLTSRWLFVRQGELVAHRRRLLR